MSEQQEGAHMLTTPWVFWEMANTGRDYSAAVRRLGDSFDTVERFWDYWNSILKPSEVFSDGVKKVLVDGREIKALAIFRENIEPKWEDPLNSNGCELTIAKSISLEATDVHWESIVLALIGEILDSDQNICGARCVFRQKGKGSFKFEIWLRDMNEEKALQIRSRLIEALSVSNAVCKPAFQLQEQEFVVDRRGKEDSQTPKSTKKY
jgi:translation initiation factor 4E